MKHSPPRIKLSKDMYNIFKNEIVCGINIDQVKSFFLKEIRKVTLAFFAPEAHTDIVLEFMLTV